MSRLVDRALAGVVDRALPVAVDRAGAPGPIRFTERQLYYELCRLLQPLHALPRRVRLTVPPPIRYEGFLAALSRRGGDVPGLLPAPAGGRPASATVAPDVFDYGLPRLLVCQHAAIADMLLANDLHMESACPVFSCADAPLDPRLTAALRRAGTASVYVLHDASAAGSATLTSVRQWFTGCDAVRVSSLGLSPAHAASLHLTARHAPAEPGAASSHQATADGLQPWERRWLRSGRSAEVAAVNPARLLRTVHRLVRGRGRSRRGTSRLSQVRAAGFMSWPAP